MWLGLGHTDRVEVSWAISYLWSCLEEMDMAWRIRSPVHYFQFSAFCGMKGSASSPLKRQFFLLNIPGFPGDLWARTLCSQHMHTHLHICSPWNGTWSFVHAKQEPYCWATSWASIATFLLCSGCSLSCANILEFSQVTSTYVEISETLT